MLTTGIYNILKYIDYDIYKDIKEKENEEDLLNIFFTGDL